MTAVKVSSKPQTVAGIRKLLARLREREAVARARFVKGAPTKEQRTAARANLDAVRRSIARWEQRLRAEQQPTIGWRSLRHVCPWLTDADARRIAGGMGVAFRRYDITTPQRAAMAVAQMAHESDGFRTSEEYASGDAYEGRRDLGNTRAGDGRRFKGRGRIMCTGRANYTSAAREFGVDFVGAAERLAQSPYSELVSCWWWKTHGCNELADAGDFVALTRRINGGLNGLDDRQRYYARARRVARYLTPR